MNRFWVLSGFTLLAATLAANPALAQRGGIGFGGDPLMLAAQESVQKELSLSEEQIDKLEEAGEQRREAFQSLEGASREERMAAMEESRKKSSAAIAEILKPEQAKRLKEISLQQQGVWALGNPEVAEAIGLSDEQKKQVAAIEEASRTEMRQLQGGLSPSRHRCAQGAAWPSDS